MRAEGSRTLTDAELAICEIPPHLGKPFSGANWRYQVGRVGLDKVKPMW